MVSKIARSAVILLVALLYPSDQGVAAAADQTATSPPQGARVKARNGDTIVIEGDDQVWIVHRKPAYVRIVADAKRALVVILAEYVKSAGDVPTGVAAKTWAFSNIEGHAQWPVSEHWEGLAWLEEYPGTTAKQRPFLLVETSEGDIAFGETGPTFPSQSGRPTTVVSFRTVNMGPGTGRTFDLAEQDMLAAVAKSGTQPPIRK
jgi:hypothetical protein